MWNLETYQQGCCADYGFDYGMRASPAPFEVIQLWLAQRLSLYSLALTLFH